MTTVNVGCKLPNGLHLDHQGVRVTLNGANSSRLIGGYGLTEVDKDFFDAWSAAYKDFGPLVNGEIFAQSTAKNAEAQAKEQATVASGFERINPEAPGGGVAPEKG